MASRYRLERLIGHGGAGRVWAGHDELLGRPVAIKEVVLQPTVDERERQVLLTRAMREARAAARLNHPSLVTVFDVVEEAGRPWIVMEYLDARSLAEVVRVEGPRSPEETARIGLQLLDALTTAHRAGVLHRDVKPGNVLLGRDGRVRLSDFGIAATTGDPTLTTIGVVMGSPGYMVPERARGHPATPSSDLWSFDATLYTLEGEPPYSGDHPLNVLSAVVDGRGRRMRRAGPLERIITQLLDRPPGRRPSVEGDSPAAPAGRGRRRRGAGPTAATAASQVVAGGRCRCRGVIGGGPRGRAGGGPDAPACCTRQCASPGSRASRHT